MDQANETQNNRIFDLARKLSVERQFKADLEASIKEVNARIELISSELAELMIAENLHRFSLEGRTYFTAVDTYPRIVDEGAFLDWLRKNGHEGLIKETVHPATLRSWYKEIGQQYEEELKNGLLEVFEKIQIRVRTDNPSA